MSWEGFRALLVDSGYLAFYLAWGEGNCCLDAWRDKYASLEPPLRPLVGLFLCGEPVAIDEIVALLGREVNGRLHDAAVIRTQDGYRTKQRISCSSSFARC